MAKPNMANFLKNSSIHGLKFLVDTSLHWSERVFWGCCIVVSWFLSTQLAIASLNAYHYNPITFVVESTYIHWKSDFPAIVICETENIRKIEEASDMIWSPSHDFNLEEVLKEIAFYKGVGYYMQKFCNSIDSNVNCPKTNFTYYANAVRSKCDEILQNCTWNDNIFDCCEHFKPIETEMGMCYAINSMQTRTPKEEAFVMTSDRKTGPGKLLFNVLVIANVYILSDEDVPTLTTLSSDILYVIGQQHYRRHVSVKNMENDLQTRDVDTDVRRCKYTDEDVPSVYQYYSYSTCIVECRKKAQMKTCNCTSFYAPNTPQKYHCDSKGLACLYDHYSQLSVLKSKWSTRNGLFCDCMPSCQEQEITLIADDRENIDDELAIVQITLDFLPHERNRRKIVRGSLDLVVSIGGTVALFIGASMLSVVEIPYFVFQTLTEIGANKRILKKTPTPSSNPKYRNMSLLDPNDDFVNNRAGHPIKLYNFERAERRAIGDRGQNRTSDPQIIQRRLHDD